MEKIKALGFRLRPTTVEHIFISDYSGTELKIQIGAFNQALQGVYKRIKGPLMILAPLEFWMIEYARGGKYGKVDWRECARDLLIASVKAGRIPDDKNNP